MATGSSGGILCSKPVSVGSLSSAIILGIIRQMPKMGKRQKERGGGTDRQNRLGSTVDTWSARSKVSSMLTDLSIGLPRLPLSLSFSVPSSFYFRNSFENRRNVYVRWRVFKSTVKSACGVKIGEMVHEMFRRNDRPV